MFTSFEYIFKIVFVNIVENDVSLQKKVIVNYLGITKTIFDSMRIESNGFVKNAVLYSLFDTLKRFHSFEVRNLKISNLSLLEERVESLKIQLENFKNNYSEISIDIDHVRNFKKFYKSFCIEFFEKNRNKFLKILKECKNETEIKNEIDDFLNFFRRYLVENETDTLSK